MATSKKDRISLKLGHCCGDPFYCNHAQSNDVFSTAAVEKDIIRSSTSTTKKVAQAMSQL